MNDRPEFKNLREKIAWEKAEREERYAAFRSLFDEATAAGRQAHDAATPTPMVVERHANPLDDDSPVVKRWEVDEGICGFAWVVVRPGNSSFARWLVKEGLGRAAYGGGVHIWIRTEGQSYERKMAYATTMAGVLSASDLLKGLRIYAGGRLD